MALQSLYASLRAPSTSERLTFEVASAPGQPDVRVGRSATAASLLFRAEGERLSRPPVMLRHLSVIFDARCRIVEADGRAGDETLHAVICDGSEPDLVRYFFYAFDGLLPTLAGRSDAGAISALIDVVIELFRAAHQAPTRSVQGLWGELLLIADASSPDEVLGCWHADPRDRFDFAAGAQRVEVKTALKRRRHRFSLEQLEAPELTVTVASIVTESSSAGLTVADLVGEIGARCRQPRSVETLYTMVGRSLGSDWDAVAAVRLDRELARRELRFFEATAIPRVREVDAEVSDVHFTADLSTSAGLDVGWATVESRLLSGARAIDS